MFWIPSPHSPRFAPQPSQFEPHVRTRTDEFSGPPLDFSDRQVEAAGRGHACVRVPILRFRMNDPLSRLASCPLQPAPSAVLEAKRTATVCQTPFSLRRSPSLPLTWLVEVMAAPIPVTVRPFVVMPLTTNFVQRIRLRANTLVLGAEGAVQPAVPSGFAGAYHWPFDRSAALGRATNDSRVASSDPHAHRCWSAP
jgi:hypothetical protein